MVRQQAETLRTGNNGNDPDADHITGQDQHKKNGHMAMKVLVLLLSLQGLYTCVCHFCTVVQ